MSACPYQQICGGCPLRHLTPDDYRQHKIDRFTKLLGALHQAPHNVGTPFFAPDGARRRAELTFSYRKGRLLLGFNAAQSHDIVDIDSCPALLPTLNELLPDLRQFLLELCQIATTQKVKNKLQTSNICQGEIWLTAAANGIDILLEIATTLQLPHRLLISDFTAASNSVIRFSVGRKNGAAETVVEKIKPHIVIGGRQVFIPAGTFLQPSQAGESALTQLVMRYLGDTDGPIADLFCGVGTFSYPLSQNIRNKITAVDSSAELLAGFQQTVNALMLPNIKIVQKNLFKYPLTADELKNFAAIVFDPPRAGAAAQIRQIAALPLADKPQKIVAVSCNAYTFINDANTLLDAGYILAEITLIDQFVFTDHFELVALFVKGEKNESE